MDTITLALAKAYVNEKNQTLKEETKQEISTNKDNIASLQSEMRTKADAIVRTVSGESLLVQDSSDNGLRGLRVFGRTIQDGTPTPDAPVPLVSVGDVDSVELGVYGANLLDITKINSLNSQGITFTNVDNEYIKVVGTATGYASTSYFIDLPNGTYVLSGCNYSNNMLLRARLMKAGTRYDYGCGDPFEVTDEVTSIQIMIQADAGWVVDTVIRPMLTRGTTPLPYEPYNKQILTVSTPNGLPGIKVTNEDFATYTDADGQMWCSDEVDLERGVYVQRIWKGSPVKTIVFTHRYDNGRCYMYGNPFGVTFKRVSPLAMSTIARYSLWADGDDGTFALSEKSIYYKDSTKTLEEVNAMFAELGTNFEVAGILAEPIETPLTSDILSMYSMLHTNYPVTTVLNDAGARMEFSYNADPKNYIAAEHAKMEATFDAKLAEIMALLPAETQAAMIDNETTNLLNESEE